MLRISNVLVLLTRKGGATNLKVGFNTLEGVCVGEGGGQYSKNTQI